MNKKNITKYIIGAMIFAPSTILFNNDNVVLADAQADEAAALQAATTAVNAAVAAPTIDSIREARELVNKLKEGQNKIDLQNQLNAIYNIDGYILDRHNASANVDVYIKCENLLSLSLSTSSITFDDYSGVQPLEAPGALTLTVKSSLNYDVNAYMPTEIRGSELGHIMDKDVLEIRAAGHGDYQKFPKVGLGQDCKVELLSNANATVFHDPDNTHVIDLNLDSDTAHTKDVYKATVKFEVVQR